MKKLYKWIVTILVSIILTTALLSNVTYAEQNSEDPFLKYSKVDPLTQNAVKEYGETGKATGASNASRNVINPDGSSKVQQTSKPHKRDTNLQSEQGSFIASALASLIKVIPKIFQYGMSQCVKTDDNVEEIFTIQNLLMGKYDLFDINIFSEGMAVAGGGGESAFNKVLRESVPKWYASVRTLAIIASLIVLLYTAVRMAMSSTTSEHVKYKKMLTSWLVGFILIFLLHYIALIMITVSEQLVRLLTSLAPTDQQPFEIAVLKRIESAKASDWNTVLQAILYFMLVWYQTKFFFMYLKRVISNSFLILIAPLVTVTYAIDKSNDCKAQAFKSWMEEMFTNVFIQPMHLLMFLILLYSAGVIAELYPIIAIMFMFGLGKAEKLLRGLFKLGGTTIAGIEEGQTFTGLISKL